MKKWTKTLELDLPGGTRWVLLVWRREKIVCPSRALAGEHKRNKRLVSENETDSKGLGASKGIGSPGKASLGPTKRPGPNT